MGHRFAFTEEHTGCATDDDGTTGGPVTDLGNWPVIHQEIGGTGHDDIGPVQRTDMDIADAGDRLTFHSGYACQSRYLGLSSALNINSP